MSISAEELCLQVNASVDALAFDYRDTGTEHVLSVAGRTPIRFPEDAGGAVHGGSAEWVSKKHHDGAIHEPGLVAALYRLVWGRHRATSAGFRVVEWDQLGDRHEVNSLGILVP